jgi:GNAT superfamily N-acetyltransferase
MAPTAVESVGPAACYALRRAVLRAGEPDADVAWPEDTTERAFHLALRDEGSIVAVASFAPSATPHRPHAQSWQLRGMAVAVDHQRHGYGRVLLDAAIARLRTAGAEVLWANARDSAVEFYVHNGMHVVGDGFLAALGLPHHVVLLDLVP